MYLSCLHAVCVDTPASEEKRSWKNYEKFEKILSLLTWYLNLIEERTFYIVTMCMFLN